MPKESSPHRHESRPSHEELSHIERQVFKLLVEPYKEGAIKIDDFADLYKASIIAADRESIERKKAHFEHHPGERRAQILEAMLGTQIELSDWFGSEAQTIPTSEYDDLFNGVDTAVEFSQENSFQHLALSIDATSSLHAITEKLARIRNDILRGNLTKIKYFVSEQMHFRGEQGQVPKVVVGADHQTIKELSDLWLNVDNLKKIASQREQTGTPLTPEAQEANHERFVWFRDRLARHPIQVEVLQQIKIQLETFARFAEKNRQDILAQRYQAMLSIIDGIIESKTDEKIEPRVNTITEALREQLQSF